MHQAMLDLFTADKKDEMTVPKECYFDFTENVNHNGTKYTGHYLFVLERAIWIQYKYGYGRMSLLDADSHTHDGVPNDMTLIEGQWLGDELQGYGRCIQALGDCYTGYYKNGKRHGSGKFQWYNGDWYDGQWQDHYQHGRGIFRHHESGYTFFGYFVQGKMVDVRVNE